jgi:hypothetical protein
MSIERQMFWFDLRGAPAAIGKTKKRILVPLSQQFTANSLTQIIHKIYANVVAGKGGIS